MFTAVTISNDAWSAATAALVLAVAVDVVMARRSPLAWLWVGIATGLAALTKYSTLAVALPLGILFLLAWQQRGWRNWRSALAALGYAAAGFVVVAGWWFVRNWLLYGEIVPLDRMAEVLPTMRRATPYTWQHTFEHIPWLIASFWGVFVAIIAPPFYLDATRWFMLIGFAGLAFGLILAAIYLRRTRSRPSLEGLIVYLVLLPWLAAVAGMVLYWTRTVEYGEQGRLAHVGASAFGVVMVAGWQAWLPVDWLPKLRSWRVALHVLLAAAALAAALALLPFLHDNFGLPPAVRVTVDQPAGAQPATGQPATGPVTPDRPLAASFDGGMRLLGVDFPAGAALEPGKPLPLTLYFTTGAPILEDYTLFLHVADAGDRLLYQFDGVPVQGRHPTRQWIAGQVFADTHTITVDELAEDGLATLSLGFYPIADPATRVAAYDANAQPIGDRLVLASLRLHSHPALPQPAPTHPVGAWQNGIVLREAQLTTDAQGLPTGIAITWTPTATIQNDYTTFVQLLDADNNILAQVDSRPQGGDYPTSTWRAGDVIADTLTWQGTASGWDRVIVGLYGRDGVRLPLVGGADFLEVPIPGG